MRKRMLQWIMVLMLGVCLAGCQNDPVEEKKQSLSIVAAGYAEYDWICQIVGDKNENVDITMLLDDGVDLHSFQPSVEDMVAISDCDLFVYVDNSKNSWVDDVLDNESRARRINLIDILGDGIKEEEELEEIDEEHAHEHEEETVDEHIWLSVQNAIKLCESIGEMISEMDPDHAEEYRANASQYMEQLKELDVQYQEMVDRSRYKTMIFCDRFPFRYLLDDYGIDYYAAFSGCSTDTDASFETVVFLSDKMKETGVSHVIVLEGSDEELGRTVLQNADIQADILTMNSMQSVTRKQASSMSYLAIMQENLKVMETVLN